MTTRRNPGANPGETFETVRDIGAIADTDPVKLAKKACTLGANIFGGDITVGVFEGRVLVAAAYTVPAAKITASPVVHVGTYRIRKGLLQVLGSPSAVHTIADDLEIARAA